MSEEQMIEFKQDQVPIKFILIPDYSETESVMFLKIHHKIFDGISISMLQQALSDNYDPNNIMCLKPFPFYHKILRVMFYPALVSYGIYQNMFLNPKNVNAIKNGKKLSGIRKGYFNRNIDTLKMKECAKRNGCSVNELSLIVISMTLYEYFKRHQTDDCPAAK